MRGHLRALPLRCHSSLPEPWSRAPCTCASDSRRLSVYSCTLHSARERCRNITANHSHMFTPRSARPRGRSHITHIVSTYVLSSPEGSASRSVPTARPEGRRATLASVDPPYTQGTNAARYLLPVASVLLTLCTLSAAALRLRAGGWATYGRLLCSRLRRSLLGLFESDGDS